jgi:hypothetical protein
MKYDCVAALFLLKRIMNYEIFITFAAEMTNKQTTNLILALAAAALAVLCVLSIMEK